MNKIILTAAIASICAAPLAASAETSNELYGDLRVSVNSIDDPNQTQDGTQFDNNTSRIGIKGEAGDDGITAFYHLQVGAPAEGDMFQDSGFTSRFFFGGLKGSFGKIAYGQMSTAYKMNGGFKIDPFYDRTRVNASGAINAGGASHGLSGLTNNFAEGAIQYTSPSFGGVKVNVGAFIDDSNEDEHATSAGLAWSNKSIDVGVQYLASGTEPTVPGMTLDGSAIRVHGGFKAKSFKVALSYEMLDNNDVKADANYMLLTGTFNINKKARISASYGMIDDDSNNSATTTSSDSITVGGFYTVAKNTDLLAIYSQASLDADTKEDPSSLSIGVSHKFGFGS